MTPEQFIAKWKKCTLKERSASQTHFNELCELLEVEKPTDADPDGSWYTFEKGAKKTGGGDGWADVWKSECFAWEYKGKHKDLTAAFSQLQRYAIALQNPPLLIVSDMETIILHTNFTNTVQQVHTFAIEDLADYDVRRRLRLIFTDPGYFRPGVTRQAVTEQAAEAFAGLAQRLRDQGHEPRRVAHFINKMLFCMFAEDIEVLPKGVFTRLLQAAATHPGRFEPMAKQLFAAMKTGGFFGADAIDWFNGGLFDDDDVLPLDQSALSLALLAAKLDWSDIEPSIFGTLFERGLDPSKRSQLGAHYTDRQSIMRIVSPVVIEPLSTEWEEVKTQIVELQGKADRNPNKSAASKMRNDAEKLYRDYLERVQKIRVLDPACGSGNFLYLALGELKDLEHRVILEAEALGFQRPFPEVGPQNVLGIEINPYAAELARVTVWIGQIQWMLRHGFGLSRNPVLQPLDQISNRDALMNDDGTEAAWPDADCIVGNPPFLGDKKMLSELGEEYVTRLRALYKGRVPGGADLVTYWFEKARVEIEARRAKRTGLVATNSIRGGANREVLKWICASSRIFEAWSDEPWINEGAAVRVSLICFGGNALADIYTSACELNGHSVASIFADLTAHEKGRESTDLTEAKQLSESRGICFMGTTKVGGFDVPGNLARRWLLQPTNPNGRPNVDVVRPWVNGLDITRRPRDMWIIDFGVDPTQAEAALYESPFEYLVQNVKGERQNNNREAYRERWWIFAETRPGMRLKLKNLRRYIATPRVSKHRLFVWFDIALMPDSALIAVARDDDTAFGILHSRFHELWALRMGTSLEDRPRYTPTTTFETFPFPEGLTPNIAAEQYAANPRAQAIADAAERLVKLRDSWLNPPDLVNRVPEVVPGYPDRLIPVDATADRELKKRTLTNLYNQKPQWLMNAHQALDAAVAAAYGWPADISDDDVLRRLLELNRSRSGGGA